VSVKAIFKRKFGKTLQIRKFKADFEFDHQWISTSTGFAWFSRNWLLASGLKRRNGSAAASQENPLLVSLVARWKYGLE
jgi:hypothetical protein